jgi:hypothetical protein
MNSINALVAGERQADLRRSAEAWRRRQAEPVAVAVESPTIALRLAVCDENDAVRRLAELDEAPHLHGEVLLALIDGEAVAALALSDGRIVADPFVRTNEAVALLRLRARHLRGGRQGRRLRALPRPRVA